MQAAAGMPAPDGASLDGVDLLPLLEGTTSVLDREALFWRVAGNGRKGDRFAVWKGDWKLVKAADQDATGEASRKPRGTRPREAGITPPLRTLGGGG